MTSQQAPGSWTNWARNQTADPLRRAAPRDTDELAQTVRRAADDGLRVRAVGAGTRSRGRGHRRPAAQPGQPPGRRGRDAHRRGSPGDGRGGIRLHRLNEVLASAGLAMRNLGDIDQQSIAGAISTGTHGTGPRSAGSRRRCAGYGWSGRTAR
ncbi:FAD-binding protein [Oerskovia sp. M15]